MKLRSLVALTPLLVALCDCGAKTGLPIPDPDLAVEDTGTPSDAPYTCVPGTFELTRAEAELVLLLDRSGSMQSSLDGGTTGRRKWDDLHDSLATTLPEFEARIRLGAMAYPHRFDGSDARACNIDTALHVEPGPNHARDVLALLESTDPWGATPTNDAVELVGGLLAARVSRTKTESIVLATDGGPNCNDTLDATTCPCTSASCEGRAGNCLDKDRTVETIAKIASRGVSVFLIGLDSTTKPYERAALEAMANAGGRPNPKPGAPPYYSVRDPTAVTDAFRTIQRSVVQCRLSMPSRPDDPSIVRVEISGKSVPRDPKHLEGWDWASTDFGQIDFYGSACERVSQPDAKPIAIVPSCKR